MSKNKKGPKVAKEIYTQRMECDCVAQKHQLINNCINCGKVVCALQGEGPCMNCGNVVSRPDSNYVIANDQSLFPSLPKDQLNKVSQERSKAILHRNKLVERDKSTTQNQNIYDEQLDYYQVTENQWIDEVDRQRAVDRILQKDRTIEDQALKYRVKLDPITGQFVRQEYIFDQQAFKDEGRKFAEEKETLDLRNKTQNANKVQAWDSRLLGSQRMKDLITDLDIGKQTKAKQQIEKKITNKNRVELILEEDLDKQVNILPAQLLNNV